MASKKKDTTIANDDRGNAIDMRKYGKPQYKTREEWLRKSRKGK